MHFDQSTVLERSQAPTIKAVTAPKFVSYDNRRIHLAPQLDQLPPEVRSGILRTSRIFPVKVNNYVLENLIDWDAALDDPMFRLLFPHPDMLATEADLALSRLEAEEESLSREDVGKRLIEIRDLMNPHPADQLSNVPFLHDNMIEGVQHKYRETALYFPKQGQTCHSYCSFCFRWPQFVATSAPKFESNDLESLRNYLQSNPHISDLLVTGGDPMVMNSRRLGALFELLLEPELAHVRTIRIGTKALTYWPYRFYADADSEQLLEFFRRFSDAGKQVAIMVHVNHWREMVTEPFEHAVAAIRGAGAILRSQAPVLAHVNDTPDVWAKMWCRQIELGIQPYYMFVERDTGAVHYFSIPLVKAWTIYKAAVSRVSGLARTARGPVMSMTHGKVQVLGESVVAGQKAIVLTMLQGRNPDWVNRPFLARHSQTATWIDQLEPLNPAEPFPYCVAGECHE